MEKALIYYYGKMELDSGKQGLLGFHDSRNQYSKSSNVYLVKCVVILRRQEPQLQRRQFVFIGLTICK